MFKPLKGSKISRYRLLKVIECFYLDIEASKAAFLVQLDRNTINQLYGIFRRLIFFHRQSQKRLLVGIVEADETYFGPARIRGRPGPRKRGRGTFKQPVFGIFERHGEVYTEIVPDCSSSALAGRATILLVAHRFSAVRIADRIHVLEGGQIAETGDWVSLDRPGTRFYALKQLQEMTTQATVP